MSRAITFLSSIFEASGVQEVEKQIIITQDELVTYSLLLIISLFCILIGTILSSRGNQQLEKLNHNYAWKVPFIASLSLCTLYICLVYFKDYANILFTLYFLACGFFSTFNMLRPIIKKIYSILHIKEGELVQWQCCIPMLIPEPMTLNAIDFFNMIVTGALLIGYLLTKHWILNNILAIVLAISIISIVSIEKFTVGILLLVGLFFYDIFWVFGTNVMVTVASSFDAPMKILIPRNILQLGQALKFSMLGLGDIVIPGWLISFLYRYDQVRAAIAKQNPLPSGGKRKANKIVLSYFIMSLLGYTLGLVATMAVMHLTKHAQPALLYLVPSCLLTSFGTAWLLNDIKPLLAFSEGDQSNLLKDEEETAKSQKKSD